MPSFVLSLVFVSNTFASVMSEKSLEFTKRAQLAKNHMGLVGASDDLPIWNGVYVAALAHKFSVTQNPDDLIEMENILAALINLSDVTGIPGVFARRIDPLTNPLPDGFVPGTGKYEGQMWKGKLSVDQYTGYLYGLMESYPFIQNPELKNRVRLVAKQIAEHFLAHDEKLKDPGRTLNLDPRQIPLITLGGKATLALQILQAATFITGEEKFAKAYKEFAEERRYLELVRDHTQGATEEITANWIRSANIATKIFIGTAIKATTDSLRAEVAQNLSHIGLYALSHAEKNPKYRAYYVEAMRRAHQWVARHSNTFWNFLALSQTGGDTPGILEAKASLYNFPMDDYGKRANSGDPNIKKYKGLSANFFKGDKWKWYAVEPLPIEKRPMHSFAWQHSAHQMDGQFGNADCPGVAYLAAYWLGRAYGFISAND
jgi:hypothetical protein